MPATIQDVVKRLTVVHTTPGAENASRRIRDVGSAMREASTSSVTYERAARASDRANARGLAQMQAYTRAVRENALAQRALNQARAVATANMGTAFGIAGGYLGYVAVAAGIGLVINRMGAAIDAHRKFEERQLSTQAMLRATGHAAGQTEASLERLARALGDDLSTSRAAVTEMLRFRSVSGATFDAALQVSKDLAATGSGDLRAAARAVGQALGDPARGLAALEAAGIRFSHQQKTLIQDLYDTGRAAESQRATLRALTDQIGGAGAMRDGSLNAAYTALGNALQRSSEQWGASIARSLRLTDVLNLLAGAIERLNNLLPGSGDDGGLVSLDEMIAARQLRIKALELQGQNVGLIDQFFMGPGRPGRVTKLGAAEDHYADLGPIREAAWQQAQAYEKVVAAIEKERRALQQTNLEREIEGRQREAQRGQMNALSQEQLDNIARLVTAKDRQRKANEAQAAAERAALRAIELSARRNLQARQSLERAQLEIDLVGQSIAQQTELRANLQARHRLEQDAARTRTAFDQAEYERIRTINAELARRAQLRAVTELRSEIRFDRDTAFLSSSDQQIASRLRQLYGGEWRSHMNGAIAQQMRFNDVLQQTASTLENNLASGLTDVIMGTKDFKTAFADTATAVLRASVDMAIRMYVLRTLMSGLGGLFGGGGGLDLGGLVGGVFGSARGNAFDRGQVIPFAAGGVVDRPFMFPMARGVGLAGEAGPEAIMPLRRGPDGRLGVAAQRGAAETQTVTVHAPVTVIAPEPQKFNQSRGQVSRTIGQAWQRAQRFN